MPGRWVATRHRHRRGPRRARQPDRDRRRPGDGGHRGGLVGGRRPGSHGPGERPPLSRHGAGDARRRPPFAGRAVRGAAGGGGSGRHRRRRRAARSTACSPRPGRPCSRRHPGWGSSAAAAESLEPGPGPAGDDARTAVLDRGERHRAPRSTRSPVRGHRLPFRRRRLGVQRHHRLGTGARRQLQRGLHARCPPGSPGGGDRHRARGRCGARRTGGARRHRVR